jgi:hypothetical protein
MFDTPEWVEFFTRVGFQPPHRSTLAGSLLHATYSRIKPLVLQQADSTNYIQIVTDGSSNISKRRVENTSFLINNISFYWKSHALAADDTTDAESGIDLLYQDAIDITRGNLGRWTAYSSDTCSIMRKIWRLINQKADLMHVHAISCDLHGL